MVCDHSFALLNALVEHFHHLRLIEYVNLCYREPETVKEMLPVINICYVHELKAVLDSVKYDKLPLRRFVKNVGTSIYIYTRYLHIMRPMIFFLGTSCDDLRPG